MIKETPRKTRKKKKVKMIKKPKVKTVLFSILSRVKSLPHTNYTPFSLKQLKSQIRHLKIEVTSPVLP